MISTRQNITSTSGSSNVQSEQSQSTLSTQNQHTIPSNNALALTQGSNFPLEQSSASILHSSMHPVMSRRYDSLSTSIPGNLAFQRLPAFTFSNQSLSTASSNHRMPSTQESGHIQYPKSTPHQFTNTDIHLTASSSVDTLQYKPNSITRPFALFQKQLKLMTVKLQYFLHQARMMIQSRAHKVLVIITCSHQRNKLRTMQLSTIHLFQIFRHQQRSVGLPPVIDFL